MKTASIILFLFLVAGFPVNASQIPEDLSIINRENIEDLQAIITYRRENTAAIYDFVWLENEETTAIIFAGISGFFYLDLTADELSARQLGTDTVYSISINPVSQIIALADGRTVHLIDLETGDEVAVLTHDFAISVEFSQDGNLLATGDGAGGIRIWDTDDYALIHSLEAEFDNAVNDLEFNETGTILASGHQRLGVHLWNLNENPPELSILEGYASRTIAFSPDFDAIAVGYDSSIDAPTISIWDLETNFDITIRGDEEQTTDIEFNEAGDMLVSAGLDHSIHFTDVDSAQQLFSLEAHEDWISAVQFSQNQSMLASTSWDGTLIIWGIVAKRDS